jgi:hypothetical protein
MVKNDTKICGGWTKPVPDQPSRYGPADVPGRYRSPRLVWVVATVFLVIEILCDHVPRFYQGDSVAYLSTIIGAMPPDRSWLYGLAVHWLQGATHGYLSYLLIQAALLLLVAMACATFLARGGRSWAFAAFVVAICLDPMLSIYERFYMSDLLACLLFVSFLAVLCRALQANRAGFLTWLPLMAAFVIADIFIRVAYAPVIFLTVLIVTLEALRYRQRVVGRLAVSLCLPVIAVGLLVVANSFVFAKRFPHELFVNKLSGVMLLGTWAPAVNASDFAAAGIDLTPAEATKLDLQNYDARGRQIWGDDESSSRILIMHRLGTTDDLSASIDRTCSRIVLHALFRNPLGMADVYVHTLLIQFDPRLWHGEGFDMETGITRVLPDGFVNWMNRVTVRQIKPNITQKRSPVFNAYRAFARAYPVILGLGLAAAVWRLLARRRRIGGILVAAGFIAVVMTVPIFTVAVIPRYFIAAVFLQYLLWAELWAGKDQVKQPA